MRLDEEEGTSHLEIAFISSKKINRKNNLQLKRHAHASVKKMEMMKKVFQMKNMLTSREN